MFLFFYNTLDTVGLSQYVLCLFYDMDADGGGAYGLLAAVEDARVQFFFQLLNHGAQRGLRHAAILGCFGKMAELVDGKDVFQLL